MRQFIEIIDAPPGFVEKNIRDEWVGVRIPLPTQEEIDVDPPSGFGIGKDNTDGYMVLTESAIKALIESEKYRAAAFWRDLRRDKGIGRYLIFSKSCCRLISE